MLVSSFILSKLLSTNKSNSIYVPYSINFISKYVLSDCSKKLEIIVIISVQLFTSLKKESFPILEIDTVIVKRRKSIQGKYTKDRKNIETNEKKSDDHLEGQMSIEDVLEESNEEIVTTNIDEKEFQEAEFENETVNKANVGVTSAFNNLLNRNKSNGGVY